MNLLQIKILAELTWNKMYPHRRLWKDIGQDAKDEWIQLFETYEKKREEYYKETPLQAMSKGNFEELYYDEKTNTPITP